MQWEGLKHAVRYGPKSAVLAVVLAGAVATSAGAVVTTRAVTHSFADAAFAKLGGNRQQVLNAIADRLVNKLSVKGGTLSSAQQEIVDRIAGVAGDKFRNVDPSKLLNDIKGQVVTAGLGKLDGINVQTIVDRVTQALIAQAQAEINKLNLNQLVQGQVGKLDLNAIVRDAVNKIDINKLVKEELDKVDLNALIEKVIEQKLSSSGSGGLTGIVGSLLSGH
jgi:hypothetical protein